MKAHYSMGQSGQTVCSRCWQSEENQSFAFFTNL